MNRPFEARIYCGLREGYTDVMKCAEDAEYVCQKYVNENGWCVTITKTRFIYSHGNEDGIIVGIIYYPRFSLSDDILEARTLELAELLKDSMNQNRVSVVFNNKVTMLEGK